MIEFNADFLLNLGTALSVTAAAYGAIRADLKNLHMRLSEERRLREEHQKSDAETFHDLTSQLQEMAAKVAVLEDRSQLAPLLMQIRDRLPKES